MVHVFFLVFKVENHLFLVCGLNKREIASQCKNALVSIYISCKSKDFKNRKIYFRKPFSQAGPLKFFSHLQIPLSHVPWFVHGGVPGHSGTTIYTYKLIFPEFYTSIHIYI